MEDKSCRLWISDLKCQIFLSYLYFFQKTQTCFFVCFNPNRSSIITVTFGERIHVPPGIIHVIWYPPNRLTRHILNTGLKQNGIIKAMQALQHQYVAAMAVIALAQCIAVSQFSLTKQPACSSIMVFTHFIDKQERGVGGWTWIHIALLKCTDSSRLFTTLVTLTHSHTSFHRRQRHLRRCRLVMVTDAPKLRWLFIWEEFHVVSLYHLCHFTF